MPFATTLRLFEASKRTFAIAFRHFNFQRGREPENQTRRKERGPLSDIRENFSPTDQVHIDPGLESKIQDPISKIECLLLTGGRSQRMGADKSKLEIEGQPLAKRIAASLAAAGFPVTVLGREPVEGFAFQRDSAEFDGPLAALAAYKPNSDAIFVAACDMPRFDPRVVKLFSRILEIVPDAEAVVPVIDGRSQPLCALYRNVAWTFLPGLVNAGRKSMMAWLEGLAVREVFDSELQGLGIDPKTLLGVNTVDDLQKLQRDWSG